MKRVLITSDDGYKATGVRVLVELLKDEFALRIAGTEAQQSGVGGKISAEYGGTYEIGSVDGVEALWVSGTPVDALDVARSLWSDTYDLVLSGINWGENVGSAMISSGTFNAAAYSLGNGLARRAVSLSWKVNPKLWFDDHDNEEVEEAFLAYPGRAAKQLIRRALREDFWGVPLLNVNFPEEPTDDVLFTRPVEDLGQVYYYPIGLDEEKKRYTYPPKYADEQVEHNNYDFGALKAGKISVSLCNASVWNGDEGRLGEAFTLG